MNQACDALVISPHPDDADLFCGASVASWTAAGRTVHLLDLTAGERASNGSVEERRAESLEASGALGAGGRSVLGLADGAVDGRDPAQIEKLVREIRLRRPRILVAPWEDDRHPDHREAAELARRAHFWSGVHSYDPAGPEPFRPRRLLFYPCHTPAPVSFAVDVSNAMGAWEEAVACYSSQFEASSKRKSTVLNRPGFLDGLRARRRAWGESAGVEFAEGFVVDGLVAVDGRSLFDDGGRANG